jgi:hypothetical protein
VTEKSQGKTFTYDPKKPEKFRKEKQEWENRFIPEYIEDLSEFEAKNFDISKKQFERYVYHQKRLTFANLWNSMAEELPSYNSTNYIMVKNLKVFGLFPEHKQLDLAIDHLEKIKESGEIEPEKMIEVLNTSLDLKLPCDMDMNDFYQKLEFCYKCFLDVGDLTPYCSACTKDLLMYPSNCY